MSTHGLGLVELWVTSAIYNLFSKGTIWLDPMMDRKSENWASRAVELVSMIWESADRGVRIWLPLKVMHFAIAHIFLYAG